MALPAILSVCYLLSFRGVSAFVPMTPRLDVASRARDNTFMLASSAAGGLPSRPLGGRRIKPRSRTTLAEPTDNLGTTTSPVKRITTQEEYLDATTSDEERLVVVKFFTPWCRSCKAMDIKFRKLAVENEDVKFFEVDVTESPELKAALGIRVVPTVKVYGGALGQVASFSCGPSKVPQLVERIERCRDVPALAARASRDPERLEMVATQAGDPQEEKSQFDAIEVVPGPADDKSSEAVAFFKRAMENMVQQRQLRAALEEAQSALFLEIAPCLA